MGRVRNKTVKRSSKKIVERYYQRLTLDFNTNKRICDEVAMIPSKRLRNKIAGFTTHMMKRISRGPVKGISLKLQEEEREKHLDYIPDISAVDLEIDAMATAPSPNMQECAAQARRLTGELAQLCSE